MGVFTKKQQNSANTVYSKLKNFLKPKDGKVHIVMINSFSNF